MANDVIKIRERFIEQMGLISQGDGLSRIAGRMIGLMIFDGHPHSLQNLASELQVSRGSISSNVRTLVQIGIIERSAVPGDRQDYFQLADDPYAKILKGALAQSVKAQKAINNTAISLPNNSYADVKMRLNEFGNIYNVLVQSLSDAIEKRC